MHSTDDGDDKTLKKRIDDHTIHLTVKVLIASDNDYIACPRDSIYQTNLGSFNCSASALRA